MPDTHRSSAGAASTEVHVQPRGDGAPTTCIDVTEGEARYLMALHDLAQPGSDVSQASLARRVGVSPPTALEMVRRLRAVGLVEQETLGLTARGMSAALVLASRRQAAEVLARDLLAVPDDQVHAEAEALATTLSPVLARHLVAWRAQHKQVHDAGN